MYDLVLGDHDPADTSYEAKRVNWKNAARKSLCSGFHAADAIIARDRRMQELVQMDNITKAIRVQTSANQLKSLPALTAVQLEWLENRLSTADFG